MMKGFPHPSILDLYTFSAAPDVSWTHCYRKLVWEMIIATTSVLSSEILFESSLFSPQSVIWTWDINSTVKFDLLRDGSLEKVFFEKPVQKSLSESDENDDLFSGFEKISLWHPEL